jgi:casein kinase II subunit beta
MSTSSGTPESWISSFCSLLGHEYFAEVSEDFIEDDFNLTGLQNQVAMYKEALEVMPTCFASLAVSLSGGIDVVSLAR